MFEPSLPPDVEPRDRLTIRRLMLLTAGVAVGLAIFSPRGAEAKTQDTEYWTGVYNAVLCGLALPAPLFCIPRAWRKLPVGNGGLFALAAGLGVLMFLPAGVVEWLGGQATPPRVDNITSVCLYYVAPLMALWYSLAVIVTAQFRRIFDRATPWTDRYGIWLGLLWSPLGAWHVVMIYADVLKL